MDTELLKKLTMRRDGYVKWLVIASFSFGLELFLFVFVWQGLLALRVDFNQITGAELLFAVIWFGLWVAIYILISWIWISVLFLLKNRSYQFVPHDFPRKYIYQGSCCINNNSLYVTNSDDGILLKSRLYKNFEASFAFKLQDIFIQPPSKYQFFDTNGNLKEGLVFSRADKFGFIFRAQNLLEYFMIQLVFAKTKKDYVDDDFLRNDSCELQLWAHTKMNGFWESHNISTVTGCQFKDDYCARIRVCDSHIRVYLNQELAGSYYLPTHFNGSIPTTHFLNNKQNILSGDNKVSSADVTQIGFLKKHGMIGFRCWDWENVIITDLRVSEIRK